MIDGKSNCITVCTNEPFLNIAIQISNKKGMIGHWNSQIQSITREYQHLGQFMCSPQLHPDN